MNIRTLALILIASQFAILSASAAPRHHQMRHEDRLMSATERARAPTAYRWTAPAPAWDPLNESANGQ